MQSDQSRTEVSEVYDIVIVGGGIAGLYCCHELIKKIRSGSLDIKKILLLEASERFGGRIETWSLLRSSEENGRAIGFENTGDPCVWNFDAPDPRPVYGQEFKDPYLNSSEKKYEYFRAEFGPMRIEPQDQPLLQALLDDLEIREPDPGEEESLDDLIPFASYASEDPMEPRFTLREEEAQQKTPFDLMILALRRIFELVEGIEPEIRNSRTGARDGKEKSGDNENGIFRKNADEAERKVFEAGAPSSTGPWYKDAANEQWRNLRDQTFFYRHYWKGELLEWIQNLTEHDFTVIRERTRFRGQPLWDLGFWNVLSDVLSHFAVVKIRDWGSYYHFVHENLNAAEWIIFWLRAIRSTGSLRGIRGGMSRIVWKLLDVLWNHQKSGMTPQLKIEQGSKLLGLKTRKNGLVDLDIRKQDFSRAVSAKRIILALPKRPLEEMLWNGDRPHGKLQEALNATVCLPLLKCFFVIDKPWWEDNRPLNRSAADLPTREILYMKSDDRTKGLIMIYTDRPAITFWSDYLRTKSDDNPEGPEQPEGPQLEYQEAAKTWFLEKKPSPRDASIIENKPGSPRLWQRFVQFARDYEHHDFTTVRLLACGMRDWGKEPFSAAAHGWRPGVRSWDHIKFLEAFSLDQEAIEAKNIHICGEAFSDYQGFVEGALRSAKRVLDKIA
jgi:monoamine oxidase